MTKKTKTDRNVQASSDGFNDGFNGVAHRWSNQIYLNAYDIGATHAVNQEKLLDQFRKTWCIRFSLWISNLLGK